jgi:transposase
MPLISQPSPEEFIRLRAEGLTIEAIAECWHYASRQSIYRWLQRWAAAGLLADYQPEHVTNGRQRTRNNRIVSICKTLNGDDQTDLMSSTLEREDNGFGTSFGTISS